MFVGTRPSQTFAFPKCCHKVGSTQLYRMYRTLQFIFTGALKDPNDVLACRCSSTQSHKVTVRHRRPWKSHWRHGLAWGNSSVLHKALTSSPLNNVGKNWNADCTLDFLTQHPCLISLWSCGCMITNSYSHVPEPSEKLSYPVIFNFRQNLLHFARIQPQWHTDYHTLYITHTCFCKVKSLCCAWNSP